MGVHTKLTWEILFYMSQSWVEPRYESITPTVRTIEVGLGHNGVSKDAPFSNTCHSYVALVHSKSPHIPLTLRLDAKHEYLERPDYADYGTERHSPMFVDASLSWSS